MPPIAQAESATKLIDAATARAADYGLIGILFVAMLLMIGFYAHKGGVFLVGILSRAITSAESLHKSLEKNVVDIQRDVSIMSDQFADQTNELKKQTHRIEEVHAEVKSKTCHALKQA